MTNNSWPQVLAAWLLYTMNRRRKAERYALAMDRYRERLLTLGVAQWIKVGHVKQVVSLLYLPPSYSSPLTLSPILCLLSLLSPSPPLSPLSSSSLSFPPLPFSPLLFFLSPPLPLLPSLPLPFPHSCFCAGCNCSEEPASRDCTTAASSGMAAPSLYSEKVVALHNSTLEYLNLYRVPAVCGGVCSGAPSTGGG